MILLLPLLPLLLITTQLLLQSYFIFEFITSVTPIITAITSITSILRQLLQI